MFGNSALDGFMHKGVTYSFRLDIEPDENCKTEHFGILADGTEIHFDWSPYSNPTKEDFALWVDLECPERITSGPLNRRDLERIRAEAMVTVEFDLKSMDTDWNRQGVRLTAAPDDTVRKIISIFGNRVEILNLRQVRK
jgi:hypothetical protein